MARDATPPPMPDLTKPENIAGLALRSAQGVEMLQQEVRLTLEGMREEMHRQSTAIGTLSSRVGEYSRHSEGMTRLAAAIEGHVQNYNEWRKEHEEANREVADRVTQARGAMRLFAWLIGGVTVVAGGVVSLIVWSVQMQFSGAGSDRSRLDRKIDQEIQRVDQKHIDENRRQDLLLAEIRSSIKEIQGTKDAR